MPLRLGIPQVRIGAVVAVGVAAGVGTFLAVNGGSSSHSTPPATTSTGPTGRNVVPISATGLQTLAGAVHQPIYWAGAEPGATYELTQETGRIYLRYLPKGVAVGASAPYLTVGTYQLATAYSTTQRLASRSGSVKVSARGGVAFYSKSAPDSVYLAFPGESYQIEVFDPAANRARSLVEAGRIVPVPVRVRSENSGARLVSTAELDAFARSLGHAVYWAGAVKGHVLEARQTTDGRAYVRYLPAGTKAGARVAALTIGTYPVTNAFSVTQGIATRSGSVQVPVTGGGIAFFNSAAPTSVYLAYPGSNVQIEVYDPRPGGAKQLVTAGAIVPVG